MKDLWDLEEPWESKEEQLMTPEEKQKIKQNIEDSLKNTQDLKNKIKLIENPQPRVDSQIDEPNKIQELNNLKSQLKKEESRCEELKSKAENFFFSTHSTNGKNSELSEFQTAFEFGNLKELLKLCVTYPNEYRNAVKSDENFYKNLREKFKLQLKDANFYNSDLEQKKFFLQAYVTNEILLKVLGEKDKEPDINSFLEKFNGLERQDNILNSFLNAIIETFDKTSSRLLGHELKIRNSSQEKLMANLVESVEKIASPSNVHAKTTSPSPPKKHR